MSRWQPMRKCAGCMQVKPQQDLLRIVRCSNGMVMLDLTGHVPGRGVYLCSGACADLAWKKRRLGRNLRCDVPFEIYQEAKQQLTGSEEVSISN